MKTARRWLLPTLLLGLAVLGIDGKLNKDQFGSQPYRAIMRFRHKVLITFFPSLFSPFSVHSNRNLIFTEVYNSRLWLTHLTTLNYMLSHPPP